MKIGPEDIVLMLIVAAGFIIVAANLVFNWGNI